VRHAHWVSRLSWILGFVLMGRDTLFEWVRQIKAHATIIR